MNQNPDQLARHTLVVTVMYLSMTAALILVFRQQVPQWQVLITAHLVGCAAAATLWRHEPSQPLLRFVRDWHPIVLFPLLYKEVEVLAAAFGDWRLTDVIPVLEAMVFGGQPSLYLSDYLSFVPLSEFLHFCYLSYVIVIPGLAGYWYIVGPRIAFHELVLLLAMALFGSYLFFILFPVDSPYYLSERLGPPLAGHLFFDFVHEVSSRGGARGGAFPSAHVSAAGVLWLVAWHHQRRLAWALTPIILGVVVATVYGRFHYALDTVAGLALSVCVVGTYRRLVRTT